MKLCVVAPTHNGAARIGPLLNALARQSLDPSRLEVLVVDNGSRDGSADRIGRSAGFRALAGRCSARVLTLPRPGLTNARIHGVRAADAEVVLFLDDDAEPDPGCCEATLQAFAESRVGVAFGRVFPKYAAPPHYSIRKREGLLAINHGLGDAPVVWKDGGQFAPTLGVALAVRRSAFLEAYPWDAPERLLPDRTGSAMLSGGDLEIGQFLGAAGWWRVYSPSMVVWHRIDADRTRPLRFIRLIVGIERSRASFEARWRIGRTAAWRRAAAVRDLAGILALAPAWVLSADGYRGWMYAVASRVGRTLGAYRGLPPVPGVRPAAARSTVAPGE